MNLNAEDTLVFYLNNKISVQGWEYLFPSISDDGIGVQYSFLQFTHKVKCEGVS